jgi:putative transposase
LNGLKKRWALSTADFSVRDIVLSHIDINNKDIPVITQADLLGISRSSIYYKPVPPDPEEFVIKNRIDEIYTEFPYYGVRRMDKQLRRDGYTVNHKRVKRLMREMGFEAIYPKPNLSLNNKPHAVYPYLLRGINITRPNQVWGTDITYIRLRQGFLYLVAFMDWFSRYVLSWRLSTMLSNDFVIEAAKEALTIAVPGITNSDQGVQFTSEGYTSLWDPEKTKISMDGRGRAMDNIFTERLWRSVKYDEVYIKNYDSVLDAKDGLSKYFYKYNNRRLHQSLNYNTPAEIYFG